MSRSVAPALLVLILLGIAGCGGEPGADGGVEPAGGLVEVRSTAREPRDSAPADNGSSGNAANHPARFPGDVGGGTALVSEPIFGRLAWWRTLQFSALDEPEYWHWFQGRKERFPALGRSADGEWIALRVRQGREGVIWVAVEALESGGDLERLRILPGAPESVMASLDWFSVGVGAWPGHVSGFRLLRRGRLGETDSRYPVVGRSLDGEWIALRIDQLEPPVVWVRRGGVAVDSDAPDAPLLVASGMEAIGPAGIFAAVERMSPWHWRADGTIVGANPSGVWHWNPDSGALRRVTAASFKPVISPDGAHVAVAPLPRAADGSIDWDEPRLVQVWSVLESVSPQTFAGVNRFRFTHHSTDPSLHWSPDSRHLLSQLQRRNEDEEQRWFVLHLDGGQSELPPAGSGARPIWLADSSLAVVVGEEGSQRIVRLSPRGALLQELELGAKGVRLLRWAPSGFVGLAQTDPGWIRIDLAAQRVARLPPLLDQGLWTAAWSPDGRSALFASAEGELVLYSTAANQIERIAAALPAGRYPSLRVRWSVDSARFAVSGADDALYIVERETRGVTLVEAESHGIFRAAAPLAWSPDGGRLLTRTVRVVDRIDANGYEVFPQTTFGPVQWLYAELQVLDRNGERLQTYRAYTNACGAYVRGEWSPDGRWLAFGGDIWDCN